MNLPSLHYLPVDLPGLKASHGYPVKSGQAASLLSAAIADYKKVLTIILCTAARSREGRYDCALHSMERKDMKEEKRWLSLIGSILQVL